MIVKVLAGAEFKVFSAEQRFAVDKWREFYCFAFVLAAYDNVHMGVIPRHHISLFGSALFYFFICTLVISFLFQFGIINKVTSCKVLTCAVFFVEVTGIYIHYIPDVLL